MGPTVGVAMAAVEVGPVAAATGVAQAMAPAGAVLGR